MTAPRPGDVHPAHTGGAWPGMAADDLLRLVPPGQPRPAGSAGPGDQDHGRKVARFALRPEPESSKEARDFTTGTLDRWGMAELCRDAMIVVSELVTNALRHAWPPEHPGRGAAGGAAEPAGRPPIEVILFGWASQLVCAVTDPCQRRPVLQEPDFAAETGRGLHVVASLSERWGWLPLGGGGKAVWAALCRPAPEPGPAGPGIPRHEARGSRAAGDNHGGAVASCEDDSN